MRGQQAVGIDIEMASNSRDRGSELTVGRILVGVVEAHGVAVLDEGGLKGDGRRVRSRARVWQGVGRGVTVLTVPYPHWLSNLTV